VIVVITTRIDGTGSAEIVNGKARKSEEIAGRIAFHQMRADTDVPPPRFRL
jgi:hypothetical protein